MDILLFLYYFHGPLLLSSLPYSLSSCPAFFVFSSFFFSWIKQEKVKKKRSTIYVHITVSLCFHLTLYCSKMSKPGLDIDTIQSHFFTCVVCVIVIIIKVLRYLITTKNSFILPLYLYISSSTICNLYWLLICFPSLLFGHFNNVI